MAYDPACLAASEENVLNFTHLMAFEMLQHIKDKFLNITNTEKKEKLNKTEIPLNQEEYLSIYFAKLGKE